MALESPPEEPITLLTVVPSLTIWASLFIKAWRSGHTNIGRIKQLNAEYAECVYVCVTFFQPVRLSSFFLDESDLSEQNQSTPLKKRGGGALTRRA